MLVELRNFLGIFSHKIRPLNNGSYYFRRVAQKLEELED